MTIINLILSFFKVGLIGFGGGSALIPIIHKEIVANKKALSEDDYLKHTVVANITPGALPVKLGSTCGLQLSNPLGSVLSAYAVAVPGVFATVFIIALFSMMGQAAIDYLNYASLGITIFIVFLLLHYVQKTVNSGHIRANTAICILAFLLTSGRVVREIIELAFGLERHALGIPLFNISMIHVMIISFYLIFYFLLAGLHPARLAVGVALALAYALLSGSALRSWPHAGTLRLVVAALFVVSIALLWLRRDKRRGGKTAVSLDRSILIAVILFLLLPFVPVAFGAASGHFPSIGACLTFLANILVSTVTSFGGGEAYVAVADSVFVQAGYCDPEVFYGRVVPVANALPGPILVKIAAALGFVWGQNEGTTASGIVLAVSSTMLAVGACCALAVLVLNYYNALKHSPFILSLKRYILPVICGTLVSTSLSMMYESMKIAGHYGFSPPRTFIVMALCVAATFLIYRKYHLHDLVLLIGWICVGMAFMMISLGRF